MDTEKLWANAYEGSDIASIVEPANVFAAFNLGAALSSEMISVFNQSAGLVCLESNLRKFESNSSQPVEKDI